MFRKMQNASPNFDSNNLQLYLRLSYTHSWGEARSLSLPSLQLFWPRAYVHLIFDSEDIQVPERKAILDDIKNVTAAYKPLTIVSSFRGTYKGEGLDGIPGGPNCRCKWHGYQRMHLDMMFADQLVKSKYVGFLDSDALFVTMVTEEAIFTPAGKPRVIAAVGRGDRGRDVMWTTISASTAFFLKKDYVVSCMSYFPVVLETAHIAEMRAYVEKIHGKPFIKVYKEMFVKWGLYCHFSIMCNYAWHFHSSKYDWHYHNYQKNRPGWDAPIPGQIPNFKFIKDTNPVVRVTTHASYTVLGNIHLYNKYRPQAVAIYLAQGFCYSAMAQCKSTTDCQTLAVACGSVVQVPSNSVYQSLLFRFESWFTWEWDPRTRRAQKRYYDYMRDAPYWIPYGLSVLRQQQPKLFAALMGNMNRFTTASQLTSSLLRV